MNKKNRLFRALILFLGLFLLLSQHTIAQEEEEEELLDLGEVISIGNRSLTLKDAYKFSSQPTIRDSVLEISTLDYLVSPRKSQCKF